jgi:hypothetical protein
LFRFDRAIQYLKENLTVRRNKLLFLNVAALLEGSPDYMAYNTGGYEKIETKNRNLVIVLSTNYQQRSSSRNLSKSGSEITSTSGVVSPALQYVSSQDSLAAQPPETSSLLPGGSGTLIPKEKRKGKSMLKNMENAKSLLQKYQFNEKQGHPNPLMDKNISQDLPVSTSLIDSYYNDDSDDGSEQSFTHPKQPVKRLKSITSDPEPKVHSSGSHIFSSMASMIATSDSFNSNQDDLCQKNDSFSEVRRLPQQPRTRQSRRLASTTSSKAQDDDASEKLTIHSSD